MKLTIVIPYPNASEEYLIWSEDEKNIDFRNNHREARRCSIAFAAAELERYLVKTIRNVTISVTSRVPESGTYIELKITDGDNCDGSFSLEPTGGNLIISGNGRAGVIYGAYELLRLQGWRWFAPGKGGEVAPDMTDDLIIPAERTECRASMQFRGFDFEPVSMESVQLLLWMARNRMNVYGWRPSSGALGRKLGMLACSGGHIFEAILNPENTLPNGKTLWEEHRNWYGLPPDGQRIRERALRTQFCVTADGLMEFLAEELIRKLQHDWYELDIVYLWGFDTWGSTCNCEKCKELGNATDQSIYFLSRMRELIDVALRDGRLDHNLRLAACIYEGTCNIEPPSKLFPDNIVESGDIGIFYPINRCYADNLADDSCAKNRFYYDVLKGWLRFEKRILLWVGEYYNVSKYEDLPLLFSQRIANDLSRYANDGIDGMTYMHLPLVNWAMRTLTQSMYAQMMWESKTNVADFLTEYFSKWYGPHADKIREAYQKIEEAWKHISQWRNWHGSILAQMLRWDGKKPESALETNYHFETIGEFIRAGRRSAELLREAMAITNDAIETEKRRNSQISHNAAATAVNPIEQMKNINLNVYEMRLGEDRRMLRYGLDTMSLMTDITDYHNALYNEDSGKAEILWRRIEQTANDMDMYYIPIGYEQPGAGLVSKDALTRTQLRGVVSLCRAHRKD